MLWPAAILAAALAQPAPSPPPPRVSTGVASVTAAPTKPAAPAFKPGMQVIDRAGRPIGAVQTMTETPGGLNVVVDMDGKLVGLLASTLRLDGTQVVSSQTRAEMLASVSPPPAPTPPDSPPARRP